MARGELVKRRGAQPLVRGVAEDTAALHRAFVALVEHATEHFEGQGGDPGLACLVLYADGSGGIARDHRPGHGERCPDPECRAQLTGRYVRTTRLSPMWPDTATGLRILGMSGPPAHEAAAPVDRVGMMAIEWIRVRDRAAAVKAARQATECTREGATSCWQEDRPVRHGKPGAKAVQPCAGCVENKRLTAELLSLRAKAAALIRELRRAAASP